MFEEWLKNHGTRLKHSLETDPRTNAWEKRSHYTVEQSVRAALAYAKGPVRFWSFCLRHAIFNVGRTPGSDGKTPYVERTGSENTTTLAPWGCRVVFKKQESEKFEPTGAEGIVLDYASHGAFRVQDVQNYVNSRGGVRVVTTRDVSVHPETLPLRTLEKEYPNRSTWTFTMLAVGRSDLGWRVDGRGRIKCAICQGLVIDLPVTRKAYLNDRSHAGVKGRPGPRCRRSRCSCSVEIGNEGADRLTKQVVDSSPPQTPQQQSASPPLTPRTRYRLRGEMLRGDVFIPPGSCPPTP